MFHPDCWNQSAPVQPVFSQELSPLYQGSTICHLVLLYCRRWNWVTVCGHMEPRCRLTVNNWPSSTIDRHLPKLLLACHLWRLQWSVVDWLGLAYILAFRLTFILVTVFYSSSNLFPFLFYIAELQNKLTENQWFNNLERLCNRLVVLLSFSCLSR